jgi:hypothetical protein
MVNTVDRHGQCVPQQTFADLTHGVTVGLAIFDLQGVSVRQLQ